MAAALKTRIKHSLQAARRSFSRHEIALIIERQNREALHQAIIRAAAKEQARRRACLPPVLDRAVVMS